MESLIECVNYFIIHVKDYDTSFKISDNSIKKIETLSLDNLSKNMSLLKIVLLRECFKDCEKLTLWFFQRHLIRVMLQVWDLCLMDVVVSVH